MRSNRTPLHSVLAATSYKMLNEGTSTKDSAVVQRLFQSYQNRMDSVVMLSPNSTKLIKTVL